MFSASKFSFLRKTQRKFCIHRSINNNSRLLSTSADIRGNGIRIDHENVRSRGQMILSLKNKWKNQKEVYDILIVGGGATGAGAALDASLRGLSVACVEREDFSSGTSSRSTKLM